MDQPFQTNQFLVVTFFSVLLALLIQNFLLVEPPQRNLARTLPRYQKIAWAPFRSNFLEILEECCDWRVTDDPHNATILWTRSGPQDIDPDSMNLGGGQLWSLVEGTEVMTDKAELHKLLASVNETRLQPETYVLGEKSECEMFFRTAAERPDFVWVSKEPGQSQGDGIVVNPKVEDLRKDWLVDPEATVENLECKRRGVEDELVLQRYIIDPLLLEGKKMEIRTYWIIASVEPFLIFYHDGTVRLTTTDYEENDWTNPLIHITNTKQQKEADPNYYQTENQRKWTVQQLGAYLLLENKIKNDTDWLNNYLRPTLKQIISTVASASHPILLSKKKRKGWDGKFELLGMDVILDSKLHPWLTEIQMGPGISRDPGVKEVVLPRMLEELTDIVLEVDRELRLGREVVNTQSAKHWQQIPVSVGGN